MPRTTTSALLKTQKSRQQEIWNQEDALRDYEWTLSDKSPEAYPLMFSITKQDE